MLETVKSSSYYRIFQVNNWIEKKKIIELYNTRYCSFSVSFQGFSTIRSTARLVIDL